MAWRAFLGPVYDALVPMEGFDGIVRLTNLGEHAAAGNFGRNEVTVSSTKIDHGNLVVYHDRRVGALDSRRATGYQNPSWRGRSRCP